MCYDSILSNEIWISLEENNVFPEHTANMCVSYTLGTLRYVEHKSKIHLCMVMSFHEFLSSDNRADGK